MERLSIDLKSTDDNFWKIMSFDFIEGKPFTKEDFNSGLKKAVLTESTAKTLYGGQKIIGKTVNINFEPYTVAGVVKDVPQVFNFACSDVFIPYTSIENYEDLWFHILFLAGGKSDFEKIAAEVRDAEKKFNSVDAGQNLTLPGPYNHAAQMLMKYSEEEPDVKRNNRKIIFVLSILLLVPAINLSGFSLSRIRKRTEEIGIRKAFGAKKYVILIQVLYENFITSLTGGIIGLFFSYFVVVWLKRWMLGVDQDSTIPLETFVSLPVFIAVFFACMLLNLLSAGIPAYKASRMKIVDSLNKNTAKS
jgi:putative ABC transport system permease protein